MKKGTVFSGVLALLATLYAAVAFSLVGGVRVYLFATKWGGLFIISRWYALLAAIVLWIIAVCLLVRGMRKASGKKTEKKAEKKTKISVRKPQQELIQPAKPEEAPAASEKTVSEDLTEVTETVEAKADEAKRQSEQREPSEQNLCPKCGAVYKEGQRFCKKCGANLLSKGEEGK